jgi:oligopeptide transport system substrate-binding protein
MLLRRGVRASGPLIQTFFIGLLAAALSLSGCARRETPVQAGNRTGTLHVGNGAEPGTLDPHLVDAYTDMRITTALLEGLCAIDERTSEPVPAAAEKWEASPDGLTWTFHLRAGLQWSNGDPLTADDFVQSWRRALSPQLASSYAYFLFPIRNAEAYNAGKLTDPAALGLAAPDARTVVITLERPTPYLPLLAANCSWYPVNPRVLGRLGGLTNRTTPWLQPANFVGNGPFTLKEWTPNARIVVEKNPRYWDAATVRLNQIVFYPIDNPDVEERNFRAGQLHLTYAVPLSKIPTYRAQEPAKLRADPFLRTFFIRFNTTKPPFDNAKLRRALSMAVDRDSISRNLLHGALAPADHFVAPGFPGYASRSHVPTDFAAARALLAEAGFPGGKGLPSVEIQVRNDDVLPRVIEAVQAMWQRELGVPVTIAQLEQKTAIQNQRLMDYTVGANGWTSDYADPLSLLEVFLKDSGSNWTGWGAAGYDQALAEAANTPSQARRFELFQQAEAILLEQAPVVPLIFGGRNYLIDSSVQGWEPAPVGMNQYKKVYLKSP